MAHRAYTADQEFQKKLAEALHLPDRCFRFTLTGGVDEFYKITAECYVDLDSIDLTKLKEIPIEVHEYKIGPKNTEEEVK